MRNAVLCCSLVALVGCTSAGGKSDTDYLVGIQSDVLSLKHRLEAIEGSAKAAPALSQEVADRVAANERKIAELESALQKLKSHPLMDGGETVKLDAMPAGDVITIRGSSAQESRKQSPVPEPEKAVVPQRQQTRPEPAKAPMPALIARIPDTAAEPRAQEKALEAPVAGTAVADAKDAEALYRQGYEMFNAGKIAQSITILRQFLQKYPSSPLADNAQYWIAEGYYSEKKFDKAITEFKKVETLPDGNKAPDAYLKIAYSFQEAGKADEAQKWKKMLVDRFPDSEAAKRVAEKPAR